VSVETLSEQKQGQHQMNLDSLMQERASLLVRFLDIYFDKTQQLQGGHQRLLESVRYSLLQEGGKRFRPVLAMLVAEALGSRPERVLPFAAAVECIHTYSLIHDDLPAMDNDDFRRGQPTNHRQFDESTAILAGDALLTEAFRLVADNYIAEPDLAVRVVSELALASGFHGMVGGQAIDMSAKKESITLDELRQMHRLKTGALIRVSGVGSAILCRASAGQLEAIQEYADHLGLAFQVADDILDYAPEKPEPGSYPAIMGIERTRELLRELTEACLGNLKIFGEAAEPLRLIARYNGSRLV
jgi:geranylgeranyl diphosphate synthase type II